MKRISDRSPPKDKSEYAWNIYRDTRGWVVHSVAFICFMTSVIALIVAVK